MKNHTLNNQGENLMSTTNLNQVSQKSHNLTQHFFYRRLKNVDVFADF